jgi:hypothetical protein
VVGHGAFTFACPATWSCGICSSARAGARMHEGHERKPGLVIELHVQRADAEPEDRPMRNGRAEDLVEVSPAPRHRTPKPMFDRRS